MRDEISRRVNLLASRPMTGAELAGNPALLKEVEVIFSGWGAPLMDELLLAAPPRLQAVFYGAGSQCRAHAAHRRFVGYSFK
ncbi:hypothetical protein Ga0100231_002470 [Opitutaceae bacterium TAV4]|nr:hypothetical protein Ga0100231_002470 [Opitutaceae bacterium TAV4]RRK01806.1 hypothetical protein Ga0100230_000605 [Opitutaceae bacterium TAV3]